MNVDNASLPAILIACVCMGSALGAEGDYASLRQEVGLRLDDFTKLTSQAEDAEAGSKGLRRHQGNSQQDQEGDSFPDGYLAKAIQYII